MEDDFLKQITEFKKISGQISRGKELIEKFMESDMYSINEIGSEIKALAPVVQKKCLKTIDVDNMSYNKSSRFLFLMEFISDEALVDYREHIKSEFVSKASLDKFQIGDFDPSDKTAFKKLKEAKKAHLDEERNIKDHNEKYNHLLYKITSLITSTIYGDTNRAVDVQTHDKVVVKQCFKNEEDFESFLKDVWNIPRDFIKHLVKIERNDIKKEPVIYTELTFWFTQMIEEVVVSMEKDGSEVKENIPVSKLFNDSPYLASLLNTHMVVVTRVFKKLGQEIPEDFVCTFNNDENGEKLLKEKEQEKNK